MRQRKFQRSIEASPMEQGNPDVFRANAMNWSELEKKDLKRSVQLKPKELKPIKVKSTRVHYKSIDKPLKLYTHKEKLNDFTMARNRVRNQYVQKYNNEMMSAQQEL